MVHTRGPFQCDFPESCKLGPPPPRTRLTERNNLGHRPSFRSQQGLPPMRTTVGSLNLTGKGGLGLTQACFLLESSSQNSATSPICFFCGPGGSGVLSETFAIRPSLLLTHPFGCLSLAATKAQAVGHGFVPTFPSVHLSLLYGFLKFKISPGWGSALPLPCSSTL